MIEWTDDPVRDAARYDGEEIRCDWCGDPAAVGTYIGNDRICEQCEEVFAVYVRDEIERPFADAVKALAERYEISADAVRDYAIEML